MKMESNDPQRAYREMLIHLSSKLKDAELANMKFLCKDDIPARVRDSLTNAIMLFESLEERNKLSVTNLEYLKNILRSACNKREDVLHIVTNFENSVAKYKVGNGFINSEIAMETRPNLLAQHSVRQAMDVDARHVQQESALTDVFILLEERLGRDALHFLRRLGVSDDVIDRLRVDNPRDIKEVVHRALRYWEDTNRPHADKTKIIAALKKENRNDLINAIEQVS